MSENYRIIISNGNVSFEPGEPAPLSEISSGKGRPEGWRIFCRMGDPALLECVCWRKEKCGESVFQINADGENCFTAFAETGLEFAMALGHFGNLCSNVRYGADIFEESGDEDA